MPFAPLKACAQCGTRYRTVCPSCRKVYDQHRGSASSRGYGAAWARFRVYFVGLLIQAGIVPACGAALPNGPRTHHSHCQAKGIITTTNLELDHDPPLEDWERTDSTRVCDRHRVQFLCTSCHSRKTLAEGRGDQSLGLNAE